MGENVQPAGPVKRSLGTPWLVLAIIVFVVLAVLVGAVWAPFLDASLRWLIIAGLMLLFLMFVGQRINNRLDGVLIDTRFKISLSRLQIALWTVLVLSAFLTIALPRSMPGGLYDLDFLDEITRQKLVKLNPEQAACFQDEEDRTAPIDPEMCSSDPLHITIPVELIIAMGISAASFAGSALVKSVKRGKKVEFSSIKEIRDKEAQVEQARTVLAQTTKAYNEALEEMARRAKKVLEIQLGGEGAGAGEGEGEEAERLEMEAALSAAETARDEATRAFARAQAEKEAAEKKYKLVVEDLEIAKTTAEQEQEGLLHRNTDPSQARWEDLFRGEEIGNYKLVDMSKVQMFFFTVILVFSYASAMHGLIQLEVAMKNPLGVDFPLFTAGMNNLLAISHAGYLTVKSVDHTPVEK
jgi:hypothetical protein